MPDDIATETAKALHLTKAEFDAIGEVERVLLADLRFEHLGDHVGDYVWHFASRSALVGEDLVDQFVRENAREIETHPCFATVDYLKVASPLEVVGIRLVPIESPEVPHYDRLPRLLRDAPIGSIAVIDVTGTNRTRMSERGRSRVAHPAPFRLEDWKRLDDPVAEFCDDAHLRAVRRWLDACATWRYTEGRSITPTAEVPGTSLALKAHQRTGAAIPPITSRIGRS